MAVRLAMRMGLHRDAEVESDQHDEKIEIANLTTALSGLITFYG